MNREERIKEWKEGRFGDVNDKLIDQSGYNDLCSIKAMAEEIFTELEDALQWDNKKKEPMYFPVMKLEVLKTIEHQMENVHGWIMKGLKYMEE